MKIALTPQPPLPERRGGEESRKFLFPSPFGRGARGEGLRNFHVTSDRSQKTVVAIHELPLQFFDDCIAEIAILAMQSKYKNP
jgi:hypothetical protein